VYCQAATSAQVPRPTAPGTPRGQQSLDTQGSLGIPGSGPHACPDRDLRNEGSLGLPGIRNPRDLLGSSRPQGSLGILGDPGRRRHSQSAPVATGWTYPLGMKNVDGHIRASVVKWKLRSPPLPSRIPPHPPGGVGGARGWEGTRVLPLHIRMRAVCMRARRCVCGRGSSLAARAPFAHLTRYWMRTWLTKLAWFICLYVPSRHHPLSGRPLFSHFSVQK